MKLLKQQKGFSIIELVISLGFMSLILFFILNVLNNIFHEEKEKKILRKKFISENQLNKENKEHIITSKTLYLVTPEMWDEEHSQKESANIYELYSDTNNWNRFNFDKYTVVNPYTFKNTCPIFKTIFKNVFMQAQEYNLSEIEPLFDSRKFMTITFKPIPQTWIEKNDMDCKFITYKEGYIYYQEKPLIILTDIKID